MAYLTYEEYKNMGGVLDSTAFNRNIDRVCGIIDNATFGRIGCMVQVPKQVKALCRDLIEYIAKNVSRETIVSNRSQSAGAVSESESYVVKTKEEQVQEIEDMIYDYLMNVSNDVGTPLLYRGGKDVGKYKTIYDTLPDGYEFLLVEKQ